MSDRETAAEPDTDKGAKSMPKWDPEDPVFWQNTGKAIANRNLWVSIPNLLLAFAVWIHWSVVVGLVQGVHDTNPAHFAFLPGAGGSPLSGDAYRAMLYTLPAVAGLAGATLRIPNSFMVGICGGRNVKAMTTALLVLPALGTGFALRNPDTPFTVFVILAALSGIGGGAFASSMSNISFFFPKRVQGLSLGLNAGLGNLGVALMQIATPLVVTLSVFGGSPRRLDGGDAWIENAGFMWVPVLILFSLLAWFCMNNLPQHRCGPTPVAVARFLWLELLGFAGAALGIVLLILPWGGFPELLKVAIVLFITVVVTLVLLRYMTPRGTRQNLAGQFAIFKNKHNWIMTYLYTMTFGSFIGYANAFPKLLKDVFGYIRVDEAGVPLSQAIVNENAPDILTFAFLGAAMGAAIRPVGGWLADKWGGARVTHWDTIVMIGSAIACGWVVRMASVSPRPETYFWPFLTLFIVLFATTGIGNGSTFRMIAVIFKPEQAGPVLGWTSAIAAYGAFLIPIVLASQIKSGRPEYAMYGFAVYYVTCLFLNWRYYARKNAEVAC
jgi:NNP family nitrate/nitrite transporter-like MFS transporter